MIERFITYLIILLSVILIDQTIKYALLKKYGLYSIASSKGKRYKIFITKNKGAFLGLGKKYPVAVLLVGIILIFVLIVYCLVSEEAAAKNIALVFFISGAVSNMIDRMLRGGVIDYLSIKIIRRSIVINFADIVIFTSAIIYLLLDFIYK